MFHGKVRDATASPHSRHKSPSETSEEDCIERGSGSDTSANWPDDASHGRRNRAWLRFWVWSFLTTKTYPGDSKRRSCILWIAANSYQFVMACAVIFLLVLDSTTAVTVTTSAYWYSELVLTCIWSVEYTLRLWSCVEGQAEVPASRRKRCQVRIRAAFHPLMLVDLVSLISLVVDLMIDSNQLRGLGALRMMRVFTLMRLERDWRICDPLLAVVAQEGRLLGGAVAIALTMLMCCSIVMFYVEAPGNPKFGSVADCLWWGTTALTTVGYGDLYPESPMGRVVASITAFLGIGLFALPAGIITAGFRNEQLRRHPSKSEACTPGHNNEEELHELKELLLGLHRRMDSYDCRLQAMHDELAALAAISAVSAERTKKKCATVSARWSEVERKQTSHTT